MAARTGGPPTPRTVPAQREANAVTPASPAPATPQEVVEAMAEMLSVARPGSAAETLRSLRLAYPDHPLALRLAGLAAAMRRTLQ